ncbi:hydrolase protein [Spatholobus suberectus]|nr:hydrolase protein [Spatholobus suberectus]
MAASSIRIAVVGDVHDYWNFEQDSKALEFLQPDLVLFTGDFGDENVEVVQSVANLEFAKAVILGNHDAWFTEQFSGRSVEILLMNESINVKLSLGKEHMAYQRSDFPLIKVSIVGGRPFSCGGKPLFRKKLLSARYGIKDMDESAKRIQKAALGTPENHFLILLAHNGPTGLGSGLNDICGKDWEFESDGDYGDPADRFGVDRFHVCFFLDPMTSAVLWQMV